MTIITAMKKPEISSNFFIELVGGLALCPHCGDYVKPKYWFGDTKVCICPICFRPLKRGKAKRRYENGLYWCSRCEDFRIPNLNLKGICCIECSTRLRSKSYTRQAKAERESIIKRY